MTQPRTLVESGERNMRRNKIVAALAAAAIFAGTSGIALAATPSPTRPVLVTSYAWRSFSFGGGSETGFAKVVPYAEAKEGAQNAAADVADNMAIAGNDAKAYFGENSQTVKDIQAAAGLTLGEDIAISEIEPFELTDRSGGGVTLSCSFDAQFKNNSVVAVLIGIEKDGYIEWHVVQGVVNGTGSVTFFLNEDLANAVAAGNAVISVASSADAFAE